VPVRCGKCGARFTARSIAGFWAAVERHCRDTNAQKLVWEMTGHV
jgi:hypothetical protein